MLLGCASILFLGGGSSASSGDFLSWLFYDSHHLLFKLLTLSKETILVPAKVRYGEAEVVSLHAVLKQGENVAVIWVLGERQSAAIFHELLELSWLVLAEL